MVKKIANEAVFIFKISKETMVKQNKTFYDLEIVNKTTKMENTN